MYLALSFSPSGDNPIAFMFGLSRAADNYKKPKILSKVLTQIQYELVKNEKISIGKAAEAIGMRKIDFIRDLGKMDIPYFNFSMEGLIEDVQNSHLESEDLE